ncbi:MAG: hypothetical protein JNK47_02435 [Mesorhizobium sp.]|nr:hypothetical protein [Mesorhizobium sp.]MBL8576058.1 hypothetical protein [Mesorhizobium sp.]
MAKLNPRQELLASKLITFRPSDRLEIARSLRNPANRHDVMQALAFYVEGWEGADWIEDYALERIGKWFSISADQEFLQNLTRWSKDRRTKARKALLIGIKKGKNMPAEERAITASELQLL